MSRKIDRVTVDDQPGRLDLSCRLGPYTLMGLTVACLFICIVVDLAIAFLLPGAWIGAYPVVPGLIAGSYLLATVLANRTRVKVTSAGIEWGTLPIPVPDHVRSRSLRADQIASIFISPMALPGKYTATYLHTYDVFALSTNGDAERLISRVFGMKAARELASLIESKLSFYPPQSPPRPSAEMRPACDDRPPIPDGWPINLFWFTIFLSGLLTLTSPIWRTIGKTEAVATVYQVGWVTRMGAKRNYQQQVCYVDFKTPAGPGNANFEENCPRSVKRGDKITIFYDRENPKNTYVRSTGKALLALIFLLPGMGGLIYLGVKRMRSAGSAPLPGQPHVLLEDKFGWLDWCWDLQKRNARARKGVLELNATPGTTLSPFLCRAAFASPTIDVQVRAQSGNSPKQAAGILFWADGLGSGYAFAVSPIEGIVECWRILNGTWETTMRPIRLPNVPPGAAWTAMRVVTRGAAADLYSNGVKLATIAGHPPPGGSFAGLCGVFPAETNAFFQFAGFRVSSER